MEQRKENGKENGKGKEETKGKFLYVEDVADRLQMHPLKCGIVMDRMGITIGDDGRFDAALVKTRIESLPIEEQLRLLMSGMNGSGNGNGNGVRRAGVVARESSTPAHEPPLPRQQLWPTRGGNERSERKGKGREKGKENRIRYKQVHDTANRITNALSELGCDVVSRPKPGNKLFVFVDGVLMKMVPKPYRMIAGGKVFQYKINQSRDPEWSGWLLIHVPYKHQIILRHWDDLVSERPQGTVQNPHTVMATFARRDLKENLVDALISGPFRLRQRHWQKEHPEKQQGNQQWKQQGKQHGKPKRKIRGAGVVEHMSDAVKQGFLSRYAPRLGMVGVTLKKCEIDGRTVSKWHYTLRDNGGKTARVIFAVPSTRIKKGNYHYMVSKSIHPDWNGWVLFYMPYDDQIVVRHWSEVVSMRGEKAVMKDPKFVQCNLSPRIYEPLEEKIGEVFGKAPVD
jgi:hypothetical protein